MDFIDMKSFAPIYKEIKESEGSKGTILQIIINL